MISADHQVTIVGGGPVGLTLAIELGQQGVSCQLFEQRAASGRLPKMERCNARTMEFYRRAGIADLIRRHGLDNDLPMDVYICADNLTQPPLVHHPYGSVNELKKEGLACFDGSMPLEPYQLISQYTLEPLLRQVAEDTPGVSVRFGHRVTGFLQNAEVVVAEVTTPDGAKHQIKSEYLIGCDGGSSLVRDVLNIRLEGDSLQEMSQTLFYCPDLFEQIPVGRGRHYHFADEHASFLIVQDDTKHFSFHTTLLDESGITSLFESKIGFPIEYETIYMGRWTQRLMLAESYRSDRVLIAGDAAHLVIPTGGLGMNTGAGDAIDLAWKMSAILHGWGGESLLDSYETERRQVGSRNVEASRRAAAGRRRWRRAWRPEIRDDSPRGKDARETLAAIADKEQRWSNDLYGIELGYVYTESPVIVPDFDPPPADGFEYRPHTYPGSRLPHLWMEDGSALHDHINRSFTLLHSDPHDQALEMLGIAFREFGAPLDTFMLGPLASHPVFEGHSLILVRPDLHVAWRGSTQTLQANAIARTVTGN